MPLGEAKTKLIVVLILTGCVGAAILLGVMFFELPWQTQDQGSSSVDLEEVSQSNSMTPLEKATFLLKHFPLIDGHNDLPWNIRKLVQNDLSKVNFSQEVTHQEPFASYNESFTDIPRLRKGHIGAQFWVAYTECESQEKDSVQQTLEQIDVIHRLIEMYPNDFRFCASSRCISDTILSTKKIASLIGIEGGHSIQSSPGILRQMYRLGVRYLTLTHICNTPWVDASPMDSPDKPQVAHSDGLSDFGLELIDEMNRLGMMVDLSHVSEATMRAALGRTKAPVIFSHSGAKSVCNHHRNVGDDILLDLKENGGIIMINFYSKFIQCNQSMNATLEDVVLHMEHIRSVIGPDHLGIGGDYDGVDSMPEGLEDVSKYPNLFARLIERGWSLNELKQVSYANILRVMGSVEEVSGQLKEQQPMQSILSRSGAALISHEDKKSEASCITSKSLEQLAIKMSENIEEEEGEQGEEGVVMEWRGAARTTATAPPVRKAIVQQENH